MNLPAGNIINKEEDSYLSLFGIGDNLTTDYFSNNNEIIDNSNELGTSCECTNDTSGQNAKFTKIYTDNEIIAKGKKFFQQSDCIDPVYKLENMDRSLLVRMERNCFIRSLQVLQLNEIDIGVVKGARELESRKINTQNSRLKQYMELMDWNNEIENLIMVRDCLKQEKGNIENDIYFYQQSLGEIHC